MASINSVSQLFKDLQTEFTKSSADLKKCGNLLEQLKVRQQINRSRLLDVQLMLLFFNSFR